MSGDMTGHFNRLSYKVAGGSWCLSMLFQVQFSCNSRCNSYICTYAVSSPQDLEHCKVAFFEKENRRAALAFQNKTHFPTRAKPHDNHLISITFHVDLLNRFSVPTNGQMPSFAGFSECLRATWPATDLHGYRLHDQGVRVTLSTSTRYQVKVFLSRT
ncbi:hypothetical protein HDV57DRAFT_80156 [Trichoderma longibrachiatum]